MSPKQEFDIRFDPEAYAQFFNERNIRKQFQSSVLRRLEDRLRYEPTTYNPRGRSGQVKRLRDNDIGEFQCDVGQYRFIYDVINYPEPVVHIRAVGVKRREKLYINGVEVVLETSEHEKYDNEDD